MVPPEALLCFVNDRQEAEYVVDLDYCPDVELEERDLCLPSTLVGQVLTG